jgi:plastocyanin
MLKTMSRCSALLVLPVALLVASKAPAQAASLPLPLPATCQDIKTATPLAPDGSYLLYNNGILFTVYCNDMTGTPAEYITLAETGANENFSQYTAGGAAMGTNVRTSYTKIGINPATLTASIGDTTFATSTGSLYQGHTVTAVPYGEAAGCAGYGDANGLANIDLENTAFQLDTTFSVGGYEAAGSAAISPDKQVANLTGGGYCGWTAPSMYDIYSPTPGAYDLPLSCAQNGLLTGSLEVCLNISDPATLSEQVQQHGSTAETTVRDAGRQVAVLGSDDQVRS